MGCALMGVIVKTAGFVIQAQSQMKCLSCLLCEIIQLCFPPPARSPQTLWTREEGKRERFLKAAE